MQMKTENSVEAASAILRTLRHAVPVLLALLIALLAAAPVLADETDEAITDTETVSAEPTEDLRDDYTAVAAQLESEASGLFQLRGDQDADGGDDREERDAEDGGIDRRMLSNGHSARTSAASRAASAR